MRSLRIAACPFIIFCLLLGAPSWLGAARVETGDLGAVIGKYGLSRSEADDVLRAYRGAVNVGIPPKKLENLITGALGDDMEVRDLVRVLTLTTNTALNGLPVGPMLNKFSEGLAKNVDGDDLVEAMEHRALSLKKARQIVSVLIYEDQPLGQMEMVLVSVASALERGADEGSIEEIFRREGPDLRKVISEIENLP